MVDDLAIVTEYRPQPGLPFRTSITSIVEQIDIIARTGIILEAADDLIGQHGVSLDYQQITFGGSCLILWGMGLEFVVPEGPLVFGCEDDFF